MPTREPKAVRPQALRAAWAVVAVAAVHSGGLPLKRPGREVLDVEQSAPQGDAVLQCPVVDGGLASLRVVVYHSYRCFS